MKFILTLAISCLCGQVFAQQWFDDIYANLATIPFDLDIAVQTDDIVGVDITSEQYNELIGEKTSYVHFQEVKTKNNLYGLFKLSNLPKGLNPPTISILGKMILNANYKGILLKIQSDPRLEKSPMIILCSISQSNSFLSGVLLRNSGASSFSGKITASVIIQAISSEEGVELKEYILRNDGYFEIISTEKR